VKRTIPLLAVAVLVMASLAHAATPPGNVFRGTITTACGGSPCSGSAPTLSTDGRDIAQARSITVRLCAASGQTLSGAGALDVYAWDEDDELWALSPTLAITVPAAAAGDRCAVVMADAEVLVGFGRVTAVPNAVTISGGASLAVKIYVRVKEQP
jgi:hypothetical protein